MLKRISLFILCLFVNSIAFAHSFFVKATIDSTLLLIGEQAKITFEITQPRELQVQLPIFSDTIVRGLEIVERFANDTVVMEDYNQLQISQSYLVTSFDSALYYIPSFNFIADDTVLSNPLSIKVLSVPVDTTLHAIADIKPVYAPPFDWMLLVRIGIILVITALVALLIYWLVKVFKNRKVAEILEANEPQRPAHEIAIEQLTALKNEKLWQQNKIKEYHTQLVDILRVYITNRFGVSALEQTSMDLLGELVKLCSKEPYDILKQILILADLVKFAKWNPLPNENDKSMADAFAFVDATKELPVEEEQTEADGNSQLTDSESAK